MIKRLLVCLAFAICPTLWGEGVEVDSSVQDSTNTRSDSKAGLSEFMAIAEAEMQSYIALLDFDEKASRYDIEKAAKALKLSLYYQGCGESNSLNIYNSELYENYEIIDFDKALYWAKVAFDFGSPRYQYVANLFKLESFLADKKAKILHKNLYERKELIDEALSEKKEGGRRYFGYSCLHSYMYFKGLIFEKDLEKAKELLEFDADLLSWKNFFIGRFAPKDVEFASFILESGKERNLSYSYYLYLIYNGEFSPLHTNKEKAKYFLDFYEKAKATREESCNALAKKEIERLEEMLEAEDSTKLNSKLARIYLSKYSYHLMFLDKNILVANPYFNIKKGEEHLAKAHPKAVDKFRVMIILLAISFNIKDSKAVLDKCLADDTFSPSEKEELKESFLKASNKAKNDLTPAKYLDTFKPTDLESI